MLDAKVASIADGLIRSQMEEREGPFGRELGRIAGDFARRNVLQSSMAILAVAQAFQDELQIRGDVALGLLKRVCSESGVAADAELAPSMKAFLADVIGREAGSLLDRMNSTPPIGTSAKAGMTGSAIEIDVQARFEAVRANVLTKVNAEVDLFVRRIVTLAERVDAPGNRVSITGSGNVVLAGAFVGSPMSIGLDAGSKAALENALDTVEIALAEVETATFNVAEVKEMVAQSKAELAKDKPNSILISSMLQGTATAIQTLPSLRPAYDALKWALLPLSVMLP